MEKVPALLSLCMETVIKEIIYGDHFLHNIFELPLDLIDCLLMRLPPLALQKLQEDMPSGQCRGDESINAFSRDGRKRKRYGDFNTVWRTLFYSRWPEGVAQIQSMEQLTMRPIKGSETDYNDDWQQLYWEAHLQNCLDEAAEIALLPSFDGCIGEITIPDILMKSIGYEVEMGYKSSEVSKLSYHCRNFGRYARKLRLQNVLCVAETCELLRDSRLQSVVLRRIKSKEHVNGACRLLNLNSHTLLSLEFVHCRLSSHAINAIFNSLYTEGIQTHGIQYLSIKASSILENNAVTIPSGVLSFLLSGRSLRAINFCDNHLGPSFAAGIFDTLLGALSCITSLDLSDNNIAGWLSNFNQRYSSSFSSLVKSEFLQSLHVLNIRGNNLLKDDAGDLKHALVHMPNLESLDISDNPIEDDGIRNLIPYFTEASERGSSLVDLKIENCSLSCNGVTQLLRSLSTLKPLRTLSISDNELGSQVAAELAKFLGTSHVRELNIEDIALGPSGFLELQKEIPEEIKLGYINISKNRGGIEAANFISKLILRSPELVAVNAGYNFIPAESLALIGSALRASRGKIELLDLTGNTRCCQPHTSSMLAEFQVHGRPIVLLPSFPASTAPYDDDP
uniref:Protein NLRC3 n=2 Tax=Nelumbo nucifera TaxID=4432 RepID=A0A822XRQ3_NELNU|nr:TPA_asm: hypothetical protein HUJ06_021611 [Nelumbo nucifera]